MDLNFAQGGDNNESDNVGGRRQGVGQGRDRGMGSGALWPGPRRAAPPAGALRGAHLLSAHHSSLPHRPTEPHQLQQRLHPLCVPRSLAAPPSPPSPLACRSALQHPSIAHARGMSVLVHACSSLCQTGGTGSSSSSSGCCCCSRRTCSASGNVWTVEAHNLLKQKYYVASLNNAKLQWLWIRFVILQLFLLS